MAKVEALDHAKRQAAASFARMASDPGMHAEVVRDEQEVLRARVDVLNTLMKNPDAKLCLEASADRKGVCVTYDRVRCEGELELGPMQSTMAWAVRGAEDTVLQLMSAADNAGHAPVVKSLLQLVQQSAPRKDILQGLHTVLSLPPPERLVLRSLAGMDAQACDAHTRVFEGLGEAAGVPPLYRVVWGALDLNVLEGWQNPSTNACVRLSILDTAHQAAREAQQTKAPAWSNVAFLQVRIFHGEECHTLTLRPFCDSESCTVTHLQYRQSVFDDSGPERGILNLSQDPASIHPIPLGKVLPIQAYVCLGAHRKSRLNEAQLNYVHAQGLLAHGFKTEYLPDPAALLRSTPGKMVPAKATRVSGDKLDVMASSYHVADQVYTTISVVQYPPFGTQFQKQAIAYQAIPKKTGRILATQRLEQSDDEFDEDFDVEIDDEEVDAPPKLAPHTRAPLNEGEIPLWKIIRVYNPKINEEGILRARRNNWKIDLKAGEHFFLDGLHANPDKIRPRAFKERFVWFELDNGRRYKSAETLFAQIKQLIRDENIPWISQECFYWNLEYNKNTGTSGLTAGQIWYNQWKPFICMHALLSLKAADEEQQFKHFWFCMDESKWDDIFMEQSAKDKIDYAFHYKKHQMKVLHSARANKLIDKRLLSKLEPFLRLSMDQIPLPKTVLSARQAPGKPIPELATLQSRIDALESKLSRTKQEANTQHLLLQVLEKLEDSG